ncbi:MAG: hypothetical protein GXZ03_03315, partial [Proteiniphilum sp.]|nr:hypothetical protein [Proteiniphilum sp.]
MKYLPWILSGALTTVILYMIWQNRSKIKPEIASDKTSQELLTIDVNSIESVLKDFFNMYGLSFNYQIEDAKSLSGALFDSFIDLKKVIENQNYIGTLANLKPILYDLESLAKASWASKETSSFINNMIQLIEHTLGITRL